MRSLLPVLALVACAHTSRPASAAGRSSSTSIGSEVGQQVLADLRRYLETEESLDPYCMEDGCTYAVTFAASKVADPRHGADLIFTAGEDDDVRTRELACVTTLIERGFMGALRKGRLRTVQRPRTAAPGAEEARLKGADFKSHSPIPYFDIALRGTQGKEVEPRFFGAPPNVYVQISSVGDTEDSLYIKFYHIPLETNGKSVGPKRRKTGKPLPGATEGSGAVETEVFEFFGALDGSSISIRDFPCRPKAASPEAPHPSASPEDEASSTRPPTGAARARTKPSAARTDSPDAPTATATAILPELQVYRRGRAFFQDPDDPVYTGDEVAFHATLPLGGYPYLFVYNNDRTFDQLHPNPYLPPGTRLTPARWGERVLLGNPENGGRSPITGDAGSERLIFVVSQTQLPDSAELLRLAQASRGQTTVSHDALVDALDELGVDPRTTASTHSPDHAPRTRGMSAISRRNALTRSVGNSWTRSVGNSWSAPASGADPDPLPPTASFSPESVLVHIVDLNHAER